MIDLYFNKFQIETNKKRSENIDKLKEFVCTDKQPIISFNFDFKGKPFFGTIKETKFIIMPVVEGRNSLVPVLKGEIIGDKSSLIVVKMRLHFIVISFILFFTILIIWSLLINMNNGGLIVLPVIYSAIIFFYLRESKKYKTKFENYFKHNKLTI
jgi:hypothetical protein